MNKFDMSYVPVNRTAKAVISRGFNFSFVKEDELEANKIGDILHWTSPPKTLSPIPDHIKDLTGIRFARFEVVGLLPYEKGKHYCWLVRCSCGNYEARRTKSIFNPQNIIDRCQECRRLLRAKKDSIFYTTGKHVQEKDII